VVDGEGQLDERAGLAEKDVGIDAGERGLPELRDGGLLPVARVDLRAQTRELRAAFRTTAGNEMKGLSWIRNAIVYVDRLEPSMTRKRNSARSLGASARSQRVIKDREAVVVRQPESLLDFFQSVALGRGLDLRRKRDTTRTIKW